MSEPRPKLTLGVTGGIAAYKAIDLLRALQTAGLDPHVVMTQGAEEFVRPLTFAALSGHRVMTGLWGEQALDPAAASSIDHIEEAQTTRLLVVAPATADVLARFAHGMANDFLTTLFLATAAPVVVAPAMNVVMWQHPAVHANLATLKARGVRVVEPESGYLACGMVGDGRLADTSTILAAVLAALKPTPPDLAGETLLITAGGTREPIDAVRFLGNRSSGRMGYALAAAAARRGAKVVLISAAALPPPPGCEVVPVSTAEQMRQAVLARLQEATLVIKAAAVADFRPATVADGKLRREAALTLDLQPTPDIAREVAQHRRPGTLLVVFAAEVDHATAIECARAKLHAKGADAVFLNLVGQPGLGFDADHNAGHWITPITEIEFPRTSKDRLAEDLLDHAIALRRLPAEPPDA